MTTEDLLKRAKEAKEIAEKATGSLQHFTEKRQCGEELSHFCSVKEHGAFRMWGRSEDVELLCHARSDIPFLAEAVEQLSAENGRLRDGLRKLALQCGSYQQDGVRTFLDVGPMLAPSEQAVLAAREVLMEDQHNASELEKR